MKIHFHLAHPAHFHLFKNTADKLLSEGYRVTITYNEKDVLENLLLNSSLIDYAYKLSARKKITKKGDLVWQFFEKTVSLTQVLRKIKPDIILGTSIIISLAGKLLNIKNVIVNEDDFDIVAKTANLGYRFADKILCPSVCRTGKWNYKCIKYNSYHELAYLHPNHFQGDMNVVKKYYNMKHPFFVLRFAELKAHHDKGIRGINDNDALKMVQKLNKFGKVFITSERDMGERLNLYRLQINPLDIHHFLKYAALYIGDSQTMAAEAGVLGTPFIRINDFVGKISYLDELENKYGLGFGVKPANITTVLEKIDLILNSENFATTYKKAHQRMLKEKIDYSEFLYNFIVNGN